MGMKMVFQPGSAYENLEKEKLPEIFFNDELNRPIGFSKKFVKFYKMTHRIDMDRLLRGISILLTGFTGPDTNDNPKNHHKLLFAHFMLKSGFAADKEIEEAIKAFGEISRVPIKKISDFEFNCAARIINHFYKLYSYNDPFGF
ncbi:MAG TPA: hypothetical protein VMZ29_04605 [Candidatus Bathyarchaeia archaeon]|nr:hypothetical protein [Candidatus Bathyarchaeia archaeon]